jgi:two-component system KDP operon response regulator KdpE
MTKVLVVDDEPQIRRALRLNLSARGYDVVEAESGERALVLAAETGPDVVLLDLGLGGIDGIGVIDALRGWSSVPVIVLTARDDERSKVLALDGGADDYITKPFGIAELLARMRAVLRRTPAGGPDAPDVTTSDFRLDLAGRRAFVGPERVETRLTPIEWAIVVYLTHHPERLVTYKQLVAAVWGANYDPDPNLLRVHMGHIRRKLEPDPTRPRYFVTDSGMGYRYQPGDSAT